MAALDITTRKAITQAVAKATQEAMEIYKEEWLSGADLCKRLPCLTADWLKRHGSKLPRERFEVVDEWGNLVSATRWMYPLHRIERGIAERKHKNIRA